MCMCGVPKLHITIDTVVVVIVFKVRGSSAKLTTIFKFTFLHILSFHYSIHSIGGKHGLSQNAVRGWLSMPEPHTYHQNSK